MSLAPDRWEALARAALRRWMPDGHWRLDEMVGAALERFAKLHAAGNLPAQPSKLSLIARNAGIDELRKLEGTRQDDRNESRQWALSIDAMTKPSGDPLEFPDLHRDDFETDIAQRLIDQCRGGQIMGADLTPQQRRVVRLLARGMTRREVEQHAGLSKAHVWRLIDQVRQIALEQGTLPPD